MILVTYDPESSLEGSCLADSNVSAFIKRLREQARASQRDVHATVSNELVVLALRHAVAHREIDPNEIRLIFRNKILQVNDLGVVLDAPAGFCDLTEHLLHEMVKAQAQKRTAKPQLRG